ncbi:coproporphyrinogen-III oxidase family protein [Rhodococcus opacus]|uniref:coproporphyrinogen-III oxidase family protein n=1 Tax=Rhodococcus opacus TaxID=37919 RepID=UPI0024733C1E|nr:radical SAM protein [Rhodococcus opacus]MDH6291952.1 coproporphyrinogen III oxidase-like Fe-S oxidoreductase [Rhodococcus opacus]
MELVLTGDPTIKFDSFVPIYNWIYPVSGSASQRFRGESAADVLQAVPISTSRALYLHIPFCETICSFCPFVRTTRHGDETVDPYVKALIEEINIKGKIKSLTDVPIRSVFWGGGTPSLLPPHHIVAIGNALSENFDLQNCTEYSFEFEVKSVDAERVEAARQIGVTHARFGAQTFSPKYRELFTLTASLDQISNAALMLREEFSHVSCDVLFGMHGEDEETLLQDVESAADLEISNLDFYPIDNLVTQPRLTRAFRAAGMAPTSGLTKHYMNILVREALKERGFLPHNGHGYVRVGSEELDRCPVVTDQYSFVYHEHVLGYPSFDLLGFGVNAVSSFKGATVQNDKSRDSYIRSLNEGRIPMSVAEHSAEIDASRPVALALPYHGRIPTEWVDTNQVPRDVLRRLYNAISHGLIEIDGSELSLTRVGWEWYSTLMHYLLPSQERNALQVSLARGYADTSRDIESSGLDGFVFATAST